MIVDAGAVAAKRGLRLFRFTDIASMYARTSAATRSPAGDAIATSSGKQACVIHGHDPVYTFTL